MYRVSGLWILVLLVSLSASGQAGFQRVNTDVGNIGLSITNVGTIGRPNVRTDPQGPPSMEYPLNSGIEHLFEGGIWIGAQYEGQTLVSTATVDATNGYVTGGSGFEFSPLRGIIQRSSLPRSDYFSNSAISHQDFITRFTDSFVVVPGTSIPISEHQQPLKAVVDLETYAWNYSYADYFVILNYTITNRSNAAWDSVYIGVWTDLVIRNVNVTQETGTAFFNKGGGGYLDSFEAVYAYQVSGDDVDFTRSYGATQFLGVEYRNTYFHPDNAEHLQSLGLRAPQVNANFWNFRTFDGSSFGAPADDLEKYQKMTVGQDFNDPAIRNLLRQASNRTQLISVGPIPRIEPGEKVTFVVAMVAARQLPGGLGWEDTEEARAELRNHLGWANRTYLGEDLNGDGVVTPDEDLDNDKVLDRYILPEPPAVPNTRVEVENGKAVLYWDNISVSSVDPISQKEDFEGFNIYATRVGDDLDFSLTTDLRTVATFDSVGNQIGANNGFQQITLAEPKTFEGDSIAYDFRYEFNNLHNGWQYMIALTAYDEGDTSQNLPSLESSLIQNSFRVVPGTPPQAGNDIAIGVYPNPYRTTAAWNGPSSRTQKIYFYNLPARCIITIYNVSGERVAQLDHNAADYNGEDAGWFQELGGGGTIHFSGGEHAWDVLSEYNQQVAQGLYIFTVEDKATGKMYKGTFAVVK